MPIFLRSFGPAVAFGIPGVLMFIATVIFWLGRKQYVDVPPRRPIRTRSCTSSAPRCSRTAPGQGAAGPDASPSLGGGAGCALRSSLGACSILAEASGFVIRVVPRRWAC